MTSKKEILDGAKPNVKLEGKPLARLIKPNFLGVLKLSLGGRTEQQIHNELVVNARLNKQTNNQTHFVFQKIV